MAAAIGIILLKLFILLACAKLAGELAERLRQPAVLGELLAGVLLGPSLLGFVDFTSGDADLAIVKFVAELGVILLLFEVGLETKLQDMMKVGSSAFLVALLGIAGSFAAGFGVSWVLGTLGVWNDTLLFHVFVGATFTATSVGITARVLSDMGRLATAEARIILGAAVLDDVGGLLILAIVTAFAAAALDPWSIAWKATLAIGFLVAALVVGLRVMPKAMDLLMRARVRGVIVAVALAFSLLLSYAAELAGLAAIVGAFAAGLILAQTRQQPAIFERIRTLGDVFVPFFFVYVGLQVDLRGIGSDAGKLVLVTALLLVVAVAGKLVSGLGVIEKRASRFTVGVGMVPRGEVGLIFALVGLTTFVDGKPLMEPWEYTAILLVVAISTFLTPIWLKHLIGRQPARPDIVAPPEHAPQGEGWKWGRRKEAHASRGPAWRGPRE